MIDYSLYLCTNSEMNNNYLLEDCVEQSIKGGVSIVQVREKNKSYNEFLKIATSIKKITDTYKVPLIINDNIEIAKKINADGIHIGQNDISCSQARKLIGAEKIIVVTVANIEEATKAIKDGANYLGVGAIFKSTTKSDATIVGIDELKKICQISTIPVVVIGGINKDTIPLLKDIKIDGYAMIRPILSTDDISKAAEELRNLIQDNKKILNK